VDRMSTDRILQDSVWAAIYGRGQADRTLDFHRLKEVVFTKISGFHEQRPEQLANRQSAASDDQHFSDAANLVPAGRPSESTPAVKVQTDAQRTQFCKHFQKLKDKKKSMRQLVNEQQYQLSAM
jgi:hypothetical protein